MENQNEKELTREQLSEMGFSQKQIDAMHESIFYENRIVLKDEIYQLKSLQSKTYKDINCYDLADVKFWIKKNTDCNDAYNNALKPA